MYKEIAFDPRCLSEFEYYLLLKQCFGFQKGRYISALSCAWLNEAMLEVKSSKLGPVKQKSMKVFLNKLRKTKGPDSCILIAKDRTYIEYDNWLSWMGKQIQHRPFDLIITESNEIKGVDIERLNDEPDWDVPPSKSVSGDAESIYLAIFPLLRISQRVTIIDPYFKVADNEILKIIFNNNLTNLNKFTLVTTLKIKDAKKTFENEYLPSIDSKVQLSLIEVPDKYFHDRYLITDVGAIRAGSGFSPRHFKSSNSDFVNMNLVSLVEANRAIDDLDALLKSSRAKVVYQYN